MQISFTNLEAKQPNLFGLHFFTTSIMNFRQAFNFNPGLDFRYLFSTLFSYLAKIKNFFAILKNDQYFLEICWKLWKHSPACLALKIAIWISHSKAAANGDWKFSRLLWWYHNFSIYKRDDYDHFHGSSACKHVITLFN